MKMTDGITFLPSGRGTVIGDEESEFLIIESLAASDEIRNNCAARPVIENFNINKLI
jgi:hypothetical protein